MPGHSRRDHVFELRTASLKAQHQFDDDVPPDVEAHALEERLMGPI